MSSAPTEKDTKLATKLATNSHLVKASSIILVIINSTPQLKSAALTTKSKLL